MHPILKKLMLIMVFAFTGLTFLISGVQAQGLEAYFPDDVSPQSSADVMALWTPERMQNAIPMKILVEQEEGDTRTTDSMSMPMEAPVMTRGWAPGSGPQPDGAMIMAADTDAEVELDTKPPFSPPANPTDYRNYAPFQRFNFPGAYMRYPRSTIGKLYFDQDHDGDGWLTSMSCTASVVQRNTIVTAGHCVHNGLNGVGHSSGWSINMIFCPSYDNGINPNRGCWNVGFKTTSNTWYHNWGIDRDYACGVTATTGSIIASPVGDITGWTGIIYNYGPEDAVLAWGYPAESPFTGDKIVNTFSTEWYESDETPDDGLESTYIGSDQNGGCSGGPWWINYTHPALNYPDTDGNSWTDPGQGSSQPYVKGLNSHKRCLSFCWEPPTSTYGTFWQEQGSPKFTSVSSDPEDASDVINFCFASGGT